MMFFIIHERLQYFLWADITPDEKKAEFDAIQEVPTKNQAMGLECKFFNSTFIFLVSE